MCASLMLLNMQAEYDEQSQMEDFGELIYAAEPVLVRDYALARGYSRVVDLLDEFEVFCGHRVHDVCVA